MYDFKTGFMAEGNGEGLEQSPTKTLLLPIVGMKMEEGRRVFLKGF